MNSRTLTRGDSPIPMIDSSRSNSGLRVSINALACIMAGEIDWESPLARLKTLARRSDVHWRPLVAQYECRVHAYTLLLHLFQ